MTAVDNPRESTTDADLFVSPLGRVEGATSTSGSTSRIGVVTSA
ncbi:MAG: hypothetical protein R2734_08610 [Nocardioides sp.]